MHITDLNECLSELPEISVMEFFRSRQPIATTFRWTGEDAVDASSADLVGPIFVDDRGIEYVVRGAATPCEMQQASGACAKTEPKVSRVSRPNKTVFFEDMTHSCDIPEDLRRALLAFAVTQALAKAA